MDEKAPFGGCEGYGVHFDVRLAPTERACHSEGMKSQKEQTEYRPTLYLRSFAKGSG